MSTFWERNGPLMTLQYVRRWALVHMDRDQSVADHSFRCWVLARDLYDVLMPTPHNSFEKLNVQLWALVHDADEHWLSDIPGHVKAALNSIYPGIFDAFADQKFKKVMPWFLEIKRGMQGTPVIPIVKICDLVESLLYMEKHATDPVQKAAVTAYIQNRIDGVLDKARKEHTCYNWDACHPWVHEVLTGDSLDSAYHRLSALD